MKKTDKILVLGGNGLVGSAIAEALKEKGYENVITTVRKRYKNSSPNAIEVNLLNYEDGAEWLFYETEPDYVFLAAAKVGGIHANNTTPVDFIVDNLMIQTNIIRCCYNVRVKKLLFLGSSCIYPKLCPQPIKEEYLLSGELENTNRAYAVAKIAGIETCRAYNKQYGTNYICAMPTNIMGEKDNFDLETSHVIPAMIAKFAKAKKYNDPNVVLWGTGSPRREILYNKDLADACIFLMENYSVDMSKDDYIINIGYGSDYTIKELAEMIKETSEYSGEIVWDETKPDGTPRKLLDCSKINNLGWKPKYDLYEAMKNVYDHYKGTL